MQDPRWDLWDLPLGAAGFLITFVGGKITFFSVFILFLLLSSTWKSGLKKPQNEIYSTEIDRCCRILMTCEIMGLQKIAQVQLKKMFFFPHRAPLLNSPFFFSSIVLFFCSNITWLGICQTIFLFFWQFFPPAQRLVWFIFPLFYFSAPLHPPPFVLSQYQVSQDHPSSTGTFLTGVDITWLGILRPCITSKKKKG